jgi:hypothetical protein
VGLLYSANSGSSFSTVPVGLHLLLCLALVPRAPVAVSAVATDNAAGFCFQIGLTALAPAAAKTLTVDDVQVVAPVCAPGCFE